MIKYKLVDSSSKICSNVCPKELGSGAIKFWKKWNLGFCDNAVIAIDGDKTIGFFRFDMDSGTLCGYGTYILSKYRKIGIGKKLWSKAILNKKPYSVEVVLTTPGATSLLESLKKKHNKVDFYTHRNY